jgi:hypothetical protein
VSDALAKKHTLAHFKFASQIALLNCTVIFTKHEKSGATIYQVQCKRMSWNCPFMRNKPYPLSKQGFYGSPIARRKLRGVPRDGRAMAANHPARNPANVLSHIRATSRQWPDSGNGNAAERPSRRLARQLALRRICPRHVRAGNLRDDSPQISTMTFKNNEYTDHTDYTDHTNA